MGDRLKIFNVNSYSSFSRSNSIIYLYLLSQFINIYLLVVSWLNLFSNLFLTFMNLFVFLFLRSLERITIFGISLLIRNTINTLSSSSWLRLVFWKSIHLEVASGPFCLLVNSPWLLVFALCIFFL